PFLEQRAVEALDLAIDLGAVGRDENAAGADLGHRLLVVAPGAIGPAVVGHHGGEAGPAGAEPGQGAPNEPADGRRRLVAEQLTEGQPGMVIDQRVDVVVAQPGALLQVPPRSTTPPVDEVTTPIRNARQLFDVHMPQLAGPAHLVAAGLAP